MRRNLAICCGLVLITLAAFWQAGYLEFVNFDDPGYVYENTHMQRGLTGENVVWAFTSMERSNWHPLTWLSHLLDSQMFGSQMEQSGRHHLVNLVFHVANTVLLFLILLRITGAAWPSALVAALFAVHPMHVESVAWVAERKDVLSTFFGLLTVAAYVRYTGRPSVGRYALVFVLLALGLMAKPMLVTLPFVLLLLDYWPLGRVPSAGSAPKGKILVRLVLEKLPLLALSVASSVITYIAQQHGRAVAPLDILPLWTRLANAAMAYVTYISKMIWPVRLTVQYPYAPVSTGGLIAAVVLLLAITAAVVWGTWKGRRYLAVGWFWFLGTLVPVIGIVQVGKQSMADRYSYLPFVGLFIIVAWGIADLIRARPRLAWVLVPACAAVVVASAVATACQVQYWKNSATLFGHAAEITQNNEIAVTNLGAALWREGRTDEAMLHFREALQLDPENPWINYNLASKALKEGKIDAAEKFYRTALKTRPRFGKLYADFAVFLDHQGRTSDAIPYYEEALEIDPEDVRAHNNLGYDLATSGKTEEAIKHYREALRIDPKYARVHYNWAEAVRQNPEEAIAHYREAIRVSPRYSDAHRDLGLTLLAQKRTEEAIAEIREAVRLRPSDAVALASLARISEQQRMPSEAVGYWREVLKLAPTDANAAGSLGVLLVQAGKVDEAASMFRRALSDQPIEARKHLAEIYAAQGKTDEAIACLQEILKLDPKHVDATLGLANISTRQGKIDDAIGYWQDVLKLTPNDAGAQIEIGRLYLKKGKLDEAATMLRRAMPGKPAEAHRSLAEISLAQGNDKEAIGHLEELLKQDPKDAAAADRLGGILLQQGKLAEAIALFRRASDAKPKNLEVRGHLAAALVAHDQVKSATEVWHEMLRIDPKNVIALSSIAWVQATDANASLRNGPEAVKLAQQAATLADNRNAAILDTLAAAYAEAGRFPEAVKTAENAQKLAAQEGNKALAERIGARLARYRSGAPFHANDPAGPKASPSPAKP